MLPATKRNTERVLAELASIQPGAPSSQLPDGTLRGRTNLHGGLHRAFKLGDKGLVQTHEYVDPRTLDEGCDTIFILSDGAPNHCDWTAGDTRDPEDSRGYYESGVPASDAPMKNFVAYYRHPEMFDEVRRLNLFRKVEIHCIGIGEPDSQMLRTIAGLGAGQYRFIGTGQ